MAWPDHVKMGISARLLIEDVINACITGLNNEATGEIARSLYELILAHAYLDRANHGHGRLRTLVIADGSGNPTGGAANNLNTAWDQVKAAYDSLIPNPNPTLAQLQAALNGIDHGGVGG
jgi:hypothetical protein